jgi:DNA repair protein RadD
MKISLYDYQGEVIDEVRDKMRKVKSVLVRIPTGGGKTVLATAMMQAAADRGNKSMFVVPRRELLRQTSETLKKYDIPHGFVAAGHAGNPFSDVTIATSGTLVRRLEQTQIPKLVFIDETQVGAAQLDRIISFYKERGCWIIGLSATPVRLDGRGLSCWYDEMVGGPDVADLISRGALSQFRLFAPSQPDLSGIKTTAGDYAKGELADYMEQDTVLVGNAVKHYIEHANGRLNVAYCTSIKHAEIVAEMFRDRGVPAAAIHGKMGDAERAVLIKAFARRELKVLTNCDLLTFGFDLSSAAQMDVTIESMSDLRPTKSLSLQMQKWGRVLRKKDFPALIFDHGGNVDRHGLPDADREWTLEGQDKQSREDAEKTEPARQCTSCYFVHRPAPVCPNCGHVYPIQSREVEQVDGELSEVTGPRGPTPRQQQGRAQTLEDLIQLGQMRGYKNPRAWASHVMKGRRRA